MNLPNKLTIVRIILVPVFLLIASLDFKSSQYICAAVFVIASLTDSLDGYIARKTNQVTTFGKFMDPLADKLIVTSALVMLVQYHTVPAWAVVIIIAREFAITGLRTLAVSNGIVLAAGPWGKAKTVTQIVAITFALLKLPFYMGLFWAAVLITLYSGIDYIVKNISLFKMD